MRRHPDTDEWDLKFGEPLRDDPRAVALFNEMGPEASSGKHATLRSTLVPPGCTYEIHEYDGQESVRVLPDIDRDRIIEDFLPLMRQHPVNDDNKMSDQTRQLLNSGLTFKEFHNNLCSNMKAYLKAHKEGNTHHDG